MFMLREPITILHHFTIEWDFLCEKPGWPKPNDRFVIVLCKNKNKQETNITKSRDYTQQKPIGLHRC